jgi:hypothetical protein
MSIHRQRRRLGASINIIGLGVAVLALAASVASARPPSHYQNWARTSNNSAGVVFHPNGDYFQVWNNGDPKTNLGVSIIFNYKGINDAWKSAAEVTLVGYSCCVHGYNFREHRHIYFYIIGPDNRKSPISEYSTS